MSIRLSNVPDGLDIPDFLRVESRQTTSRSDDKQFHPLAGWPQRLSTMAPNSNPEAA